MNLLTAPLQYEYMAHALIAAAFLGTTCAALSVFLLLKGWSLIGDGLAHATLPGVAIAYLINIPYLIGALISGLLATTCITYLSRHPALKRDAVIGFSYSAFLALGLLILSIHPISISLTAIMYGNILAIPNSELIQIGLICTLALTYLALQWRNIALMLYDTTQARISHSRPQLHNLLLSLTLALTIISGIQSIGIILITALIILPGATARLLTRHIGTALLTAATIGCLTAITGTYISYYIDTLTTAVIVILQSILFFLALITTLIRRHV